MYFISENFTFNDISNKLMGVELVTFESDTFNQIGMTYEESIDKQDSPPTTPFYISSSDKDTEEISLNFMLTNGHDEAKVWNSQKFEEVYNWLITENFVPFISEDNLDRIYYFKTVKITKKMTHDMRGYLEVTFKPYSNYGYDRFITEGVDRLVINNTSNTRDDYKPVIELTGTGSDVSIVNTSIENSEPFTISTLEGKIVIDNLFRTVQTEDGVNLLHRCNRKWIRLKKGLNILKVTGGTAKVMCEFPIVG